MTSLYSRRSSPGSPVGGWYVILHKVIFGKSEVPKDFVEAHPLATVCDESSESEH